MTTTCMRLKRTPAAAAWRYRDAGRHNVESSPTVVDGVVYVGSKDGYLYALNTDYPQTWLWRYRDGGNSEIFAGGG